MGDVSVSREGNLAVVTLTRGKVNALNESMVGELSDCFAELEKDGDVKAVILTGRDRFFSFGLDIPELMDYSIEDFTRFITKFTALYTRLFVFPKPLVCSVNGHAMAGGCMLASACDYRMMADGKARISLNEIGFGSTVLAGSVYMLQACVGHRNAEKILFGGTLFSAREALALGLVDQVCDPGELTELSRGIASDFAAKAPEAFSSIKKLCREPVASRMRKDEPQSIEAFVKIWYSETVRENLKQIKIF